MIDYKQIFNAEPHAYLRTWYKSITDSQKSKTFEYIPKFDGGEILYHIGERPVLFVFGESFFEDAVKNHAAANKNEFQLFMQQVDDFNAIKNEIDKRYETFLTPYNLVKMIEDLMEKRFTPSFNPSSYELIRDLYLEKTFFYNQSEKEILNGRTRIVGSRTSPRIRTLFHYDSNWQLGETFAQQLVKMLDDFIDYKETVDLDDALSDFMKVDVYAINFEELKEFCKIYSPNYGTHLAANRYD